MPTDTQRLVMESYRSDEVVTRISKFLDKSSQALMFLFSPKDTSGTEGVGKRKQVIKYSEFHIPGLMKALFWIAFSISIAILVGRLG